MHYHFLGIKWSGVVGLASILQANGHTVTGSDVSEFFYTDAILHKLGITPRVFDAANAQEITPDMVVYSPAYSADNNVEFAAFASTGVPMMSYPEAVGAFWKNRELITITGTHGKTTTSAMLGFVLKELQDHYFRCQENAHIDVTHHYNLEVLIGSKASFFDDMSAYSSHTTDAYTTYFVLEACEYKRHFLHYSQTHSLVTNIDFDHPDYFADKEDYLNAYKEHLQTIPTNGICVLPYADKDEIRCEGQLLSFSMEDKNADIYGQRLSVENGRQSFLFSYQGKPVGTFFLSVPGMYNIENALCVLGFLYALGFDMCAVRTALAKFSGTTRRQELKGYYKDSIPVYDDYAHHPDEIFKTIQGLSEMHPNHHIIVVFQPHTYSRTQNLWDDFVSSFVNADTVIIQDIFASAREQKSHGISGERLAQDMAKKGNWAYYIADDSEAADFVFDICKKHSQSLIITLGAGNAYKVGELVLQKGQ